jgi:hypothetical protein
VTGPPGPAAAATAAAGAAAVGTEAVETERLAIAVNRTGAAAAVTVGREVLLAVVRVIVADTGDRGG